MNGQLKYSGIENKNPMELSNEKGRIEDSLFEGIYDPNATSPFRVTGMPPVAEDGQDRVP